MIEIEFLFFNYNNSNDIFKNLSLIINDGSSMAIVGNSGCGKSTLLNLIAGILKPCKGQITKDTNNMSYLMQDVTLLPYKTAFENVLLAFQLRNKVVDENTKKKATELLKLFQIDEDSFGKYPSELSGGMKQRIGLVQTLITDPELLLLDEPFNAIDVNALETIESYIWDDIKKAKRTMVMITHNIEQALLLSDRVLILGKDYAVHEVIPSTEYITLPPSQRAANAEFKKLFFDIVEKMKL